MGGGQNMPAPHRVGIARPTSPMLYWDVPRKHLKYPRTVRTTVHTNGRRRPISGAIRASILVSLICVACLAMLALAGCGRTAAPKPADQGGLGMAGSAAGATIKVTRAAIESTPPAPVLDTPQAAVKSYLAWSSYAYRIGLSDVASATMTAAEGVRIDAYIELNLQKNRLIDQGLSSIAFGKSSVDGTHTLIPTKETWEYRYVSTDIAGKSVGGPYTASYDTIYTVVKGAHGTWLVDSVAATPKGEVK